MCKTLNRTGSLENVKKSEGNDPATRGIPQRNYLSGDYQENSGTVVTSWFCQSESKTRTTSQDRQETTMESKIKELAITNALTDAYLILQDAKRLKTSLAMELQAARGCRVAQEREFREFMNELWKTLRTIQAQFKVEAQLLNLVRPEEAGEKRWQKENRPSNRCRTLDVLSKKTH